MQKVGIYSGTFDPVHEGHLSLAREAIKQAGLEKVFFMVEKRPRRKQGVKAYDHRVRMVQLAIAKDPKLGNILLDQDRFTVNQTLPLLTKRLEGVELHMLLGSDMFKHLSAWPGVSDLLDQTGFVIGLRGTSRSKALELIKDVEKSHNAKIRCQVIESPMPDVSSTEIKRDLKNTVVPASLPAPVADYIRSHNLYTNLS